MAQIPDFRVTLRAVLLFEKLTARSFTSIDLQNEEDAITLIYCLQRDTPTGVRLPLVQWKSILKSDTLRAEYYKALGRALEELGEASTAFTLDSSETASALGAERESAQTFTEIATTLIVTGGLSPAYVMDRLELWELPALLEALESRTQEALERSRLFTWLTMLPHLAQDSAKSPEELLPFPWEVHQETQERRNILDLLASSTFNPDA